jgi:UDP-glucose 4-epimerase
MKILITGGAGFIASHIADAYIALGHEVIIIDNLTSGSEENIPTKARFINMDITSPEIINVFEKEKFDVINHHAAQMNVRFSVQDPVFDAKTNIIGTVTLCEAAIKTNVKKIIFASSGGTVYGEQKIVPTPENVYLEPCSPYGIAKLANEKYLSFYSDTYGIDTVCLRYANVYGPRQNPHGEAGVIAIFIEAMNSNKQPIINGEGNYTRDYVFIKDAVNANVIALGDKVNGIYNVGTAIETSTNDIFRNIKMLLKSNCKEIHGDAKKGEQIISCISYKKFKDEHNWQPQINLLDGLKETIDDFLLKHKK